LRVCFVVTSVIDPWTEEKYAYGSERSAFTASERYSQSIKTVRSIREHTKQLPYVDTLFVDGGQQVNFDRIRLEGARILYVGKNFFVRKAISSKSKAFGEAALMISGLPAMIRGKYDYFFKISGRYFLNENFLIEDFDFGNIVAKDIYDDKTEMSTRLFGFPANKLTLIYGAILRRWWKLFNPFTVYEGYLLKGIGPNNVSWKDEIGVEGFLGVSNEHIVE